MAGADQLSAVFSALADPNLAGPSEQGRLEAFTALDATLTSTQISTDREGVLA